MVIYALVQAEAGIEQFIYLIGVLDVITDLVIDDTGRLNESCNCKACLENN